LAIIVVIFVTGIYFEQYILFLRHERIRMAGKVEFRWFYRFLVEKLEPILTTVAINNIIQIPSVVLYTPLSQ
jgi:hypothetical protein